MGDEIPPRRNRIPLEHRKCIVRAFEDEDEEYLIVADTLGVNRSTGRGIVARYIREGRIHERPRGGRNHVRVDDEMRDCLEEIINENCFLTLYQINRELRRLLPAKPIIHDRTVARTLDGMLFKVKLVRPLPDRDRPDVLERRNMQTGSCITQCYATPCSWMNVVTTSGRPGVTEEQDEERKPIGKFVAREGVT